MEDILVHLDIVKKILKEKKDKSPDLKKIQNKSPFSTNSEINNHNTYKSYNHHTNNNYNKSITITRPSIINLNKNIKKIDFSHKFCLIEEGSDSEDCLNEDSKETIPSLMKVAKQIFDPNEIMILTDINYFPKEATPGLIITGVEEWVTEKHIKYFLQDVPTFVDSYKRNNYYNNYNHNYDDSYLDIISIKIFVEQKNRYAYVQLNSFSQMEAIGNFFLAPIKKLYPSYNSKKEKIEVYYAYNLLELTKNHWYGVILRNLPANCNDRSLYNFTEQKVENGIKYCLNPILVDNLYCALVVCKELEYAEKLCFDLNNSEINNKLIRAHLHPYICKIRNEENYKNYETFSKNGYEYNNIIEESEKCIEHSKTFMEFFFSNYINTFFNSKSKKKEEDNKLKNDKNSNNNSNESKNKKIIKDKDKEKKSKKKNDLTLASSIFNLFKKSKSKEEKKKINNSNPNLNIINNNNNSEKNINKDDKIIISKLDANSTIINTKVISNTLTQSNDNKNNLEKNDNIKKESIDNNNINEKKEIVDIKKVVNNEENKKEKGEKRDIPEINKTPKYNEKEIKYYTYNMGDINYYDEKEKEEQRKLYSKSRRNNRDNNYNYNHNYSNYNNNYNSSYSNHNNYNHNNYNHNNHSNHNIYNSYNNSYNSSYKKYEYKNNSPRQNYYKNYNYRYNDKAHDRERDKDREKEFSNDSQHRRLERSRDRIIEEEKMNKNKNKNYNDSDINNKRNEKDRYTDDRNRKYNDNKYYDKNNNKYNDKINNKYYDKINNKYYERNERRKDSWHSRSRNKNEKRDKYNDNN